MDQVRVLIVEDSPVMRNFLAEGIGHAPGFSVVATAHNGGDALEKLSAETPDVVTLDVELPDTDGISLLEQIMQVRPIPVVMVSALTQSGAQVTLRALQCGAADFVGKPNGSSSTAGEAWLGELLLKLRRAATLRPMSISIGSGTRAATSGAEPSSTRASRKCQERLVVVGSGSGATDSLRHLLRELPRDCPPILVAHQCSPVVVDAFVSRLSRESTAIVRMAKSDEGFLRGHVYVGPGDAHMSLARISGQMRLRLHRDDAVHGHRPSLDLLFESVAKQPAKEVVAVLLDAAGDDGIAGLKLVASSGNRAIRQLRDPGRGDRAARVPSAATRYQREPVELQLSWIWDAVFSAV
jgi:two-component system chemotaxis response regulator CheB